MGRPVVLGNGRMLVGLNESGLVHDFYFPYVGLDNLTNARSLEHKIGVWVDGIFSWVDDNTWNISTDFEQNALISRISMHSERLSLTLDFVDFVDYELTAFVRHIEITNHASSSRDVRLFMHQVFEISHDGRADTAIYVPEHGYILNYKGRRCLIISGKSENAQCFDQFAVGNYGVEGKSGTYMDATDGNLSGNLVEHGGVDSVIRFSETVNANSKASVDYWIVADTSQSSAREAHLTLKRESIKHRLDATHAYFQQWLSPAKPTIDKLPDKYKSTVSKSLLVIKAHCDIRGSVLASGDSSIFNYGRDYYCYCWPRDASYALWPLIRLGIYDEAKRFFKFAKDVLHKDGYLLHKYQPDRAIGSTWHPRMHRRKIELPIQEDETAGVLFMMNEYYEASGDNEFLYEYYEDFIKPTADFISSFVDEQTNLPHASYDLWEEKFLTSTYTVSITIAALRSASKMAEAIGKADDTQTWNKIANDFSASLDALYHPDGYFRKGFELNENGDLEYDDAVDISSLYGPFMYAKLDGNDSRLKNTGSKVEESLLRKSPAGGVIRYENDNYFRTDDKYPGNPWIVCTMWLAQYYIYQGQNDQALVLIDWVISKQTNSGVLGEQFDATTGQPLGVTPLIWSHAELVSSILDLYGVKANI